ncbi:unnamed protein product [Fusarium graminearum]|nr:unnamed protein product [Fusarium graminearum]
MRTLNTINSSSSRPTSPGLSVSQPRTRRPLTPSTNDKLVASSKPLPKIRSQATTGKTQVQAQAQAQARPRFSSAGNTRTSSPSLGFHDPNQQHVLSVTATITSTRSTSSSSAPPTSKMAPSESRHRPPQLSAAAAKTVGRTPLTPKIASTSKGSVVGAPPLVRRSTQGLSAVASHRDETAITPRSGSRQSRNNSNTTTPSGTPSLDQETWNPRNSLTSLGRLSRAESPADPDAKFFRASDAPTPSQPSGRPSIGSQKSNNFFHASKATSEFKKATSPSAAPYTSASNAAPEPLASKFFYANGVDLDLKPTSANASSSRLQSKRPSTSSSTNEHSNNSQPSRPHSPTKNAQPNPSILKNAVASGISGRPQVVSPLQIASPPLLAPAASITAKRRVSIESAPKKQRGHARAGSVPNFDHSNSPRLPMSPARRQHELSPPSSPGTIQPALTMASILQMAEDISDEEEEDEEKDTQDNESQPDLQSPTKSSHGEPVNDLVANARRERKVQDLEITNASLEAINRTLERQMRKQQAEIRRFRRLSRSGRLSAVASAASSRVTSAALTDIPISLSDLSEEEDSEPPSEEEDDSLDESDMSTDSVSAPLDPNDEKAMEKAMARRKRDEDRLQLDLSKHRDILVDSQKINQSIKRCLNWTEVLIKEGQKALEYKVRVTDVEFGGQILPPLNDDEDDDLSEMDDFGTGPGSPVDEPPLPWEKSSQDRDSGIELQPDSS